MPQSGNPHQRTDRLSQWHSIPLTHHEFFTLLYLAQHPSWVLSKEQIYEAVWKADPEHCGAAVANVVYSLRRKIGEGYIKTVVGSGYRFVGVNTDSNFTIAIGFL
ncbi:winged helix-turn-helix domain-containing protein [Marvinbryantia formatexigens]|uniref:winged helix-turn-helix domain-containing protein n=1 Tax=Marvinbryantia formatexigens TaxID=168384 RepID=UPI002ADE7466|nr:winged helix-turn-helix domain-containing protein [Marvinbryantia formatexigens]